VVRRRLNRRGNRQANSALWRIVMVRMVSDPRTRDYVERRTKEGRSTLEIIRVLKRYVARDVYHHFLATKSLRRRTLARKVPGAPRGGLGNDLPSLPPSPHPTISGAWPHRSLPRPRGPSLVYRHRAPQPRDNR
jgi:hypothetical protein